MSGLNYFGCLDFRNAKFQGAIRDSTADGVGIFLDNEFLWVLSNWKNYVPSGFCLAVYPNRDIFYGKIRNGRPDQVCCLVRPNGESCFFNFVNGVAERIAYISNDQTILQIQRGEIELKLVSSQNPKGKEQLKWRIISDILRANVVTAYKTPKLYVRQVIQGEFNQIIECSQSSGTTFIGFKNTVSLGIKIDKEGRVKSVGNYESFPRNLQFGRLYTDSVIGTVKIEEGKFGENQRLFQFKGQRPAQAARFTQQFFKRGTSFKNTFVKFTVFEQISRQLQQIQRQIRELSILEHGQKILEGVQSDNYSSEKGKYQNKEYSIEEIRKDLEKVVVGRKNTTRRGIELSPHPNQRTSSREKYFVAQEKTHYENSQDKLSISARIGRSKYKYTDEVQKEGQTVFLTQKRRKYVEPYPDVSEYDHRIQEAIFKLQKAAIFEDIYSRTLDRVFRPLNYNVKTDPLIVKEKAISKPAINLKQVSQTPAVSQVKSEKQDSKPLRELDTVAQAQLASPPPRQNTNWQPSPEQLSKFQHYSKYKNRKKATNKQISDKQGCLQEVTFSEIPNKKYQIYERKFLGPKDETPSTELKNRSPYVQQQPTKTNNPETKPEIPSDPRANNDMQKPTTARYRKNYKYI